jgi:hypothetical protein
MTVRRVRWLALVGVCCGTAALSAPVSESDAPGPGNPAGDAARIEAEARSGAGVAGATGNKTIDLLLQAQSEDAAIAARAIKTGPRTAPPTAAASTASAGDGPPLDQLKSAMNAMGVGPIRAPSELDPELLARRQAREQERLERTGGEAPATAMASAQRSLLDLPLVRFIRENRLAVVAASVAVLALVWGAATFSLHRHRS